MAEGEGGVTEGAWPKGRGRGGVAVRGEGSKISKKYFYSSKFQKNDNEKQI